MQKHFTSTSSDGDSLFRAGNTLKEVYYGLLKWRWASEDEAQETWLFQPDNGEEYYTYDYFPFWRDGLDENGGDTQVLSYPLLPFIPHRVASDDDIFPLRSNEEQIKLS